MCSWPTCKLSLYGCQDFYFLNGPKSVQTHNDMTSGCSPTWNHSKNPVDCIWTIQLTNLKCIETPTMNCPYSLFGLSNKPSKVFHYIGFFISSAKQYPLIPTEILWVPVLSAPVRALLNGSQGAVKTGGWTTVLLSSGKPSEFWHYSHTCRGHDTLFYSHGILNSGCRIWRGSTSVKLIHSDQWGRTKSESQTFRPRSHHTCRKTDGNRRADFTCRDTRLHQFSGIYQWVLNTLQISEQKKSACDTCVVVWTGHIVNNWVFFFLCSYRPHAEKRMPLQMVWTRP